MAKLRISRILAPTDFSELATSALHYAGELARRTGAELVVLYADPFLPPPHFTSSMVATVAAVLSSQKENARVELARYAAANVPREILHRSMVVEGHPVSAIVDAADEIDADVIVMGTHGRSGLNRLTLGSVTERVLHETSHPLLTVRPTDRPVESAPSTPAIVCPVDLSDTSAGVFAAAVDLADSIGATVSLVHVREPGVVDREAPSTMLASWIPESHASSVSVVVLDGNPAEAVIGYAKRTGADLIVLGARHRPFADTTVIGTTTSRLTRHAPCPVLTLFR